LAVAVALVALAALFLSRDHARAVRADPAADRATDAPALPKRSADPHAMEDIKPSPIAPSGRGTPETFTVEVVSSPDNRPVAGARVEVRENSTDRLTASTITNSAGLASLTAKRTGGTLLVVSCRGFVPTQYWLHEDERDTPTILLPPGITVDGVVTFADTGQPAADVEVLVQWPFNAHLDLRTDARGRFEIPGVEIADRVVVRARLPGYQSVEVEHTAGPAHPHVEVVLGRGGRCEGRVVDEAAKPVAGASVRIGEPNPWFWAETVTDADGRFMLRGIAEGKEHRALAHAADHRSGASEPFTCDADQPVHRCEIVVHPHARVAVALSFPDGSPVVEATVAVSRQEGWSDQRWCTAVAGSRGVFESGPVEPGENELRVGVRGWPFRRKKITVSPGVRNEVALQLEEKLGMEGTVTDREGNPLRDIEVELLEPRVGEDRARIAGALTDDQGRFRLRGLEDEAGTLVCADGDARYLPLATEAKPGQPPLHLVLDRRPRIVGRLDPAPESRGIDAEIGLLDGYMGALVRVGRDGRFDLRRLVIPAGREFWLKLEAGHDVPWIFLSVDLAPDETLDLGTLRPPKGVRLEGVVTDRAGAPLADAEVIASAEIDDLRVGGGADTDALGHFAIADLADVPLQVHANREGYAPWRTRIERPGATPPLTIVLEPGGALEVLATPWDVEVVEIEAAAGGFRDSLYTSQKESSVVWLKPGAYRVNDTTIEIRVGETTRFELRR
jgi:protocatechuate 3,4-dioxygenase beta subunit